MKPLAPVKGGLAANGELTPAAIDHYQQAFAGYEDPAAGKGLVPPDSLRNLLADCGVHFNPTELQQILIPQLPPTLFVATNGSARTLKPLTFKAFLEAIKKAIPLAPNPPLKSVFRTDEDDVDGAVDAGGGVTLDAAAIGHFPLSAANSRRLSRRDSCMPRDARSENAALLEKLQEVREQLADGLSALSNSVIQNSTTSNNGGAGASSPLSDSMNAGSGEASAAAVVMEAPANSEEDLVQDCLMQLDLLGFLVGADVVAPDSPSGTVTAAALVSYIDMLAQSLSAALAAELEWVEAYSADDLVAGVDDSGHGGVSGGALSSSMRGRSKARSVVNDEQDEQRVERALRELEGFSFQSAAEGNTLRRQQGGAAFRAKVRDFPFFMFPIDSVCSRLDALDELQERYEKALKGREFLLVPKCPDGRSCRQQDVPEHRLSFSHPCFSSEVPCPHRHRSLHMKCYSHPEDDDPQFEVKLKALQRRLGVIELSGMELGDDGAHCLAHVLQQDRLREKQPQYQELHMAGNQISPGGAVPLLEGCFHLVYVDLSANALGYKTVALMQTSAIGPALQTLLVKSEKLTYLNLSRNRLSDRDGRYIAEGLKTNTSLKHLDLRKNELGAAFGAEMAVAVGENRDLRELLLGWNRLESAGSTALLMEMKTSSTLEVVDLSWTGISDEGAKAVAEMITGSLALRILGLSHNNIGPDGASCISSALKGNKSLQSLDLSFNPIGTKSASELVKDLRENYTLELLDIRCVKAGEEVTEDIKRSIKLREPKMQQQGLKMVIMFSTSVVGGGGPSGHQRRR